MYNIQNCDLEIVENILASNSEGPHIGDYWELEDCPNGAVDNGWFNGVCVKYLDNNVCGVMVNGDGGEYYLPAQWGKDYAEYKKMN